MSLLNIFPLTSDNLEKEASFPTELPQQISECKKHLLIHGEKGVGKSSLLFQCAVTIASEGSNVTFICPQPFTKIPKSVQGMPKPAPSALRTLKFLYITTFPDLVEFFATIHTRSSLPALIIIDDLDFYVSRNKDGNMEYTIAKLSAMITDAVHFINKKSEDSTCCLALAGTDHNKLLQTVGKRFNMNPCCIQAVPEYPSVFRSRTVVQSRPMEVTYAIADDGICMQTISLG